MGRSSRSEEELSNCWEGRPWHFESWSDKKQSLNLKLKIISNSGPIAKMVGATSSEGVLAEMVPED